MDQLEQVLYAAENMAEDFPGGARALGVAIGENPGSFTHAVYRNGTAKLGLFTAVKMSRRARDPRVLNAFAAVMGYLPPLPMPEALDVPGDAAMGQVAVLAKEFSDVVREISTRVGDGISANDVAAIRREWSELMAAGQKALGMLEAMHVADEAARGGAGQE
jgi:hypothetical protein